MRGRVARSSFVCTHLCAKCCLQKRVQKFFIVFDTPKVLNTFELGQAVVQLLQLLGTHELMLELFPLALLGEGPRDWRV